MKMFLVRSQSFQECHRLHVEGCRNLAKAKDPKPYDVKVTHAAVMNVGPVHAVERAVDVIRHGGRAFIPAFIGSAVAGCCEKRVQKAVSP